MLLTNRLGNLAVHDRNAPSAIISHAGRIPADPFAESVYRLIPEEIRIPEKKAMYRSKFSGQATAEYKSGLKSMASIGPPTVPKEKPELFLKKHAGEQKLKAQAAAVAKAHPKVVGPVRPPVPKHNELSKLPANTKKNFIKMNALENIHSSPKKPRTPGPVYVYKPDYGRTPEYVVRRKAEQDHEYQRRLEQLQQDGGGVENDELSDAPGLVQLPEDERLNVLEGLKRNWEKLNTDYQKLSLTVDTVPKIARKVNMESQLKRLEEDIQKFSVPNVYVNFYD